MRLLLNLLWIVFGGGLVLWLEYLLGGLILCLTIIGIPFGVQCFKIAGLALLPFGKDIEVARPSDGSALATLFNVLWFRRDDHRHSVRDPARQAGGPGPVAVRPPHPPVAPGDPRYRISSSSTSNSRVAPGGMTPPAPRDP
jgi:hypothetical protein